MSKDVPRTTLKLNAAESAELQKQLRAEPGQTRRLEASEIAELNQTLDAELSRVYAETSRTTLNVLECAIRAHSDPDTLIHARIDGREFQIPQRLLRLFRFVLRRLTNEDSVNRMRALIETEAGEYEDEEYDRILDKLF